MRDEAFERLYAEHAEALFGFLVYRIGDRAAAEDLLADTFERVLTAPRGFDRRRGTERAWLHSIALNLVRDRGRRSASETRAYEKVEATPPPQPRLAADAVPEQDALQHALSLLSDEEREAIALRFGADLTAPETARVLGQKLTTVEGRIYRALRKLGDHLER